MNMPVWSASTSIGWERTPVHLTHKQVAMSAIFCYNAFIPWRLVEDGPVGKAGRMQNRRTRAEKFRL